MPTIERGLFVTFEGLDGSGKTTQLNLFAERLRAAGRTVQVTTEPGGTQIGNGIRRVLLDRAHHQMSPVAELLLYFAARAQNVDELIEPALARGEIVVSDRFTDSSLAYQGAGRELGEDVVMALDRVACRGRRPDLTFYIAIDPRTGLSRAHGRNRAAPHAETRMDEQSEAFYQRVYEAYERLAAAEPGRIRRVEGSGGVDEVAARVWRVFEEFHAGAL
jgi:dTMP kinase